MIGVLTDTQQVFYESGRKAEREQTEAQLNEKDKQINKIKRVSAEMLLKKGESPNIISDALQMPLSEVLELQKKL